jgi:adenine-specific DNA-methyltransferase
VLEPYIGQSGEVLLSLFTVESLDQAEDYLLFAAAAQSGAVLDEETAQRLLSLPALSIEPLSTPPSAPVLHELTEGRKAVIQRAISGRNARFFELEAEKLDGWADDLKIALEREIKDIDRQIKEAKRAAMLALTLEEKLEGQKQIKALEMLRNGKRRALFDAQDEIDRRREQLIADIESRLTQKVTSEEMFMIQWKLV